MEITGKAIKIKKTETFQSGFQKRTVVVKTAENIHKNYLLTF